MLRARSVPDAWALSGGFVFATDRCGDPFPYGPCARVPKSVVHIAAHRAGRWLWWGAEKAVSGFSIQVREGADQWGKLGLGVRGKGATGDEA